MGDLQGKARLLAWAVRQGGTMVIIQAALGMECVGMSEQELVCCLGEEREEQRQEEQRRTQKRRKRSEKAKGSFCKGCPQRHVDARGENDRF